VAKINDEEKNLDEKISNIIMRLEEEPDTISKASKLKEFTDEPTKTLEVFEEMLAEFKSKKLEDYSRNTELPTAAVLWKEIEVTNFLPYVTNFSVRLKNDFKKLQLFQSITINTVNKLMNKVNKPKKNSNSNDLKVLKSKNLTKKMLSSKTNRKVNLQKSKVPKFVKNPNPSKLKPEKQNVSKVNKDMEKTLAKNSIDSKKSKSCKLNGLSPKIKPNNIDVFLTKPQPTLKSILSSKKQELVENRKKVTFCNSIFIRKFVIDSSSEDSDSDYS
jgi:hypothetical protein